jgi:hypothetical protein
MQFKKTVNIIVLKPVRMVIKQQKVVVTVVVAVKQAYTYIHKIATPPSRGGVAYFFTD